MKTFVLALSILLAVASAVEASTPIRKVLQNAASPGAVSEETIAALFDTWNAALVADDVDAIVDLYAEDAVLLPTVSNEIRTTPDRIGAYFTEQFLPKDPSGTVTESHIKVIGNVAIHNGKYDFATKASDGTVTVVPARFTYVYERSQGGDWKIVTHHSSAMPEPVV